MNSIILEYRGDGCAYDKYGNLVGSLSHDSGFDPEESKLSVKQLADLKAAGFDSDEIIAMKKEGVI